MKLHGHVEKNRFNRMSELIEIFQLLNDKDVTVTIEKTRKDRSNQQNKYYWGWVVKMISEEIGDEKDEVHSMLGGLFLKDYMKVYDVEIPYIKSTTKLSTIEMNEYIEECRRWASKTLGLFIPDPH